MNRFEQLISRHLDGEPTSAESDELAAILQADRNSMEEFINCYELDRLLQVLHTPSQEAAVESVMVKIRRENDPFVDSVASEIRRGAHPESDPNTSAWEWISRWLETRGLALGLSSAMAVAAITCVSIWILGPTTSPLVWRDSTDVPTVVGTQFTVTHPISGGARYYRLRKP